jgi:hypothetical protein
VLVLGGIAPVVAALITVEGVGAECVGYSARCGLQRFGLPDVQERAALLWSCVLLLDVCAIAIVMLDEGSKDAECMRLMIACFAATCCSMYTNRVLDGTKSCVRCTHA